jgi:hypothetical protein
VIGCSKHRNQYFSSIHVMDFYLAGCFISENLDTTHNNSWFCLCLQNVSEIAVFICTQEGCMLNMLIIVMSCDKL